MTTSEEARNPSGSLHCSLQARMCAQPEHFALGGAEQSLTPQGAFSPGCHRVCLAAIPLQCSLPGCRGLGDPAERGAGWVGWAGAAEPEPSDKDNTAAAPTSTNHPRACLRDNVAYSWQAEELAGRAGAETEEAAPPPGCCALQSSTFIPCRTGTTSLCSLCLCVLAQPLWAGWCYCSAEERAALPTKVEGHPRDSSFQPEGQQVSRFMASQNLCAVDKLLFRSRNSRLSGWLSDQTLSYCVPTEFYAKIKKVLCKNTYQVPMYRKENFTSACRDAYVGTETTRTSPFISQKRGN